MISVIIPTYHPQPLIYECLDSLAKQTLSHDEFEIIISINGDREPWFSQISTYVSTHMPDIQVEVHFIPETGVSGARNKGLDVSHGEYIAFIDDDDIVSPSYLEQLFQSANYDTVPISNTIAFSESESHLPYSIEREYHRYYNHGKVRFFKTRKFFSGPCMKLIHRDVIGSRRFDPKFRNGEDSLFMFQISDRIKYTCCAREDAVYYRRVRGESAHFSQDPSYKRKNCIHLIKSYSRIYWSHPHRYQFCFYLTRLLGAIKTIFLSYIESISHRLYI